MATLDEEIAEGVIYPHEIGAAFVQSLSIDYSEVPSETQANLAIVGKVTAPEKQIARDVKQTGLAIAATVNQWAKKKNKSSASTITKRSKAYGDYVKLQLDNSAGIAVSNEVYEKYPDDQKIKWLPSSADEQDVEHATYYGQTMTMKKAQDLGLGTRPGCKCGMKIL